MSQIKLFNSRDERNAYEASRKKFYSERIDILANGSTLDKLKLKWKENFNKEYKAKKQDFDSYSRGIWRTKNPNHFRGEVYICLFNDIYDFNFKPGDRYTQVDKNGKIVDSIVF